MFREVKDAYDVGPASTVETGTVRTVSYDDIDGFQVAYTVTVNADGDTVMMLRAVSSRPAPR